MRPVKIRDKDGLVVTVLLREPDGRVKLFGRDLKRGSIKNLVELGWGDSAFKRAVKIYPEAMKSSGGSAQFGNIMVARTKRANYLRAVRGFSGNGIAMADEDLAMVANGLGLPKNKVSPQQMNKIFHAVHRNFPPKGGIRNIP